MIALGCLSLAGCEPPLNLAGVEAGSHQATQRSDLLQAAATNGEAVVVVGGMGVVVVSSDQGQTWRRQQLAGKPFLLDVVHCPDATFAALAHEGSVWFGDRGGTTWREVSLGLNEAPQALACDPKGRIWVVGGFSTISHSADRGGSWTTASLGEDLYFTSIQFVDARTAMIAGEFGVLAQSLDAGVTWEFLDPIPEEFYPQDALFESADVGWVVGLDGVVLHTTDGGRTWLPEPTGVTAPLYAMANRNGRIYAVGASGALLRYEAGHWAIIRHGQTIRSYLRAVLPIDGKRLLIAGGAGALHVVSD